MTSYLELKVLDWVGDSDVVPLCSSKPAPGRELRFVSGEQAIAQPVLSQTTWFQVPMSLIALCSVNSGLAGCAE